jgi:hypothetical protein
MMAARIKKFMGSAAVLLGPDGKPLATWKNNKDGTSTDWQAAYLDLKPAPDHIATFTKSKPGARPFILK